MTVNFFIMIDIGHIILRNTTHYILDTIRLLWGPFIVIMLALFLTVMI